MKPRDKEQTKQKLIDAVASILEKNGFKGFGINAIAKEAGVDKVLIYRYFGNLDNLLEAFADQHDYFSNMMKNLDSDLANADLNGLVELGKKIFIGQLRQILKNRNLQEVLLWELSHKNNVTQKIAENREGQATTLMEQMEKVVDFNEVDIPAISALISGGINYLVLRSATVDVYNGVELNSEAGWQRIENAVRFIMDRITIDPKSPNTR